MTPDERLDRFADLVVRVGANVQPGQEVVLIYLVEHTPIARAVVRAALRAGAPRVHPVISDLHLRKAAIEYGPEAELGRTPEYLLDWIRTWDDTRPALISLTGDPEPTLFDGLDPELVAKAEARDVRMIYLPLVMGRKLNWVIVPAPNPGWAEAVLGEPDVERLWDAVADDDAPRRGGPRRGMARARRDAPEACRRAQRARISTRSASAGRAPTSSWACSAARDGCARRSRRRPGSSTCRTSRRRRCSRRRTGAGPRASCGRPTRSWCPGIGKRVEGLELRFEGGKVVDVQAEGDGAEVIRAQIASDERAPFLGEVALVDGSSRVRETGLVFENTLFDENASCHVAYGSGLPFAVDGAEGLDTDELISSGVNVAGAPHGLHDRRPRGRGRRAGRGRCGHADPPRQRLGAARTPRRRSRRRDRRAVSAEDAARRRRPAGSSRAGGTARRSRSARRTCRAG